MGQVLAAIIMISYGRVQIPGLEAAKNIGRLIAQLTDETIHLVSNKEFPTA